MRHRRNDTSASLPHNRRDNAIALLTECQDISWDRCADSFYATQGAYAEYIIAPRGNLIKKPAHLSWAEAASIPEVLLTGMSLRRCCHAT